MIALFLLSSVSISIFYEITETRRQADRAEPLMNVMKANTLDTHGKPSQTKRFVPQRH